MSDIPLLSRDERETLISMLAIVTAQLGCNACEQGGMFRANFPMEPTLMSIRPTAEENYLVNVP
jgi:hypothetical protein